MRQGDKRLIKSTVGTLIHAVWPGLGIQHHITIKGSPIIVQFLHEFMKSLLPQRVRQESRRGEQRNYLRHRMFAQCFQDIDEQSLIPVTLET